LQLEWHTPSQNWMKPKIFISILWAGEVILRGWHADRLAMPLWWQWR
jgi:hypothetical protein